MEPLFRQLIVGLVPAQMSVSPAPYTREALQQAFLDVSHDHPYQAFNFLPGEAGIQMTNSPNDLYIVQPGLLQIQTPVELTPERAREKVVTLHRKVARRLGVDIFLVCGIKVIAHVPAPGPTADAKAYVTDTLMRATDKAEVLGPGFFGGGIKYRNLSEGALHEEILDVEPLVNDNSYLYVDFDVQRRGQFQGVDELSTWIDDAFSFVSGPAMRVLDATTD